MSQSGIIILKNEKVRYERMVIDEQNRIKNLIDQYSESLLKMNSLTTKIGQLNADIILLEGTING